MSVETDGGKAAFFCGFCLRDWAVFGRRAAVFGSYGVFSVRIAGNVPVRDVFRNSLWTRFRGRAGLYGQTCLRTSVPFGVGYYFICRSGFR